LNQNRIVVPNRKEIFGWGMYDFANSAFATTISSVVFNVYFTQVVVGESGADIFGHKIPASSLWGYTVSLSVILVIFTSPILGAIADFSGTKKKFLFLYCYLACLFTGLLFFAKEGDYIFAMILYVLANYFFAGSLGFYNAFLPEISTKENIGRISGFGWALGFIGGGILLAINLVMIRLPELFGIPDRDHLPVRFVILSVAIWWAVFAVFTFLLVRERRWGSPVPVGESYLRMGFKRLVLTFKKVRQHKELFKFLITFLIYNEGIETVIVMAAVFASELLGMSQSEIVTLFLLGQIVAFSGSLLLGYFADKFGNKQAIILSLVVWCAVVVWAYFIKTTYEFWTMGVFIAFILGGSQAVSRSLFGLFTPRENTAEFFGFYALSGKFSSAIGPFTFAFIRHAFDSIRVAVIALIVFFALGFLLVLFVNERRGIEESMEPIR
jgi:UMF1 family MFS transporter